MKNRIKEGVQQIEEEIPIYGCYNGDSYDRAECNEMYSDDMESYIRRAVIGIINVLIYEIEKSKSEDKISEITNKLKDTKLGMEKNG